MSADAGPLSLRRATMEDAELLLRWANDPDVRRASFNTDPIELDTHLSWLQAKLASPDTAFYICERARERVGYARVERRDDGSGEIAVSVESAYRGHGLGRRLIALASARSRAELGVRRVVARVKVDNVASVRAFRGAGYVGAEETAARDGMLALSLVDQPIVPHSRPFLGDAAAAAAAKVVRSRALVHGKVASELEERWCAETGTAAAACVASGVAALRLGLLALGVGAGDEVVVPAYSCVALLNAPLALGADPVLADVELDDWTLSVEDVRRRLTPRTRAIVAVNLFGMPSRLAELTELGLPVIEDCAHGIGGQTSAGPFGGGSELSMSSFYATKMIGAGEGGIVAARSPELVEPVRRARDYGDQLPSAYHLNDKLTDVEAAIALEQLRRLTETLRLRAERVAVYDRVLAPLAERGLAVRPESRRGRIWYRYALRLLRHDAAEICGRMAARGVRAEQPVWDLSASAFWGSGLEASAEAFHRVISLPLYPDLSSREQELVCDVFADCLEDA